MTIEEKEKTEQQKRSHAYYLKNRERILAKSKQYSIENRHRRLAYQERYRSENSIKIADGRKSWWLKHGERVLAQRRERYAADHAHIPKRIPMTPEQKKARRKEIQRAYFLRNRESINAKSRAHYKKTWPVRKAKRRELMKKDPVVKMRFILRCRMAHALKGSLKAANTSDLIGCSANKMKLHLESKWSPGMSWDNYGFGHGKWVVDHIKPIAAFDLMDPEQQRAAFHFSNLQPMWWSDNAAKSSKHDGIHWRIDRRTATLTA